MNRSVASRFSCMAPCLRMGLAKFAMVIRLFAVVGFLEQVFQVSIIYFAYKTNSQTNLIIVDELKIHTTAVCIRFRDIVKEDRLLAETGIQLNPVHAVTATGMIFNQKEDLQNAINDEGKFTLKQIFNHTPKSDGIIASCMHRPSAWDIMMQTKKCANVFRVTRFFTMESICYEIREVRAVVLKRRSITTSTFYRSQIFELILSREFENASIINILSYMGKGPWVEMHFNSVMPSFFKGTEKTSNLILYYSSDVFVHRLPPPFDTHCVHQTTEKMRRCYTGCWKEKMAGTDKLIPWDTYWEKDADERKPLTVREMKDRDMRDKLDDYEEECDKSCLFNACLLKFTRTTSQAAWRNNVPLGIVHTNPTDPEVVITFLPRMSFLDFFVYICTCFGTWFGLSFLSFMQLRAFRKRKISDASRNNLNLQRTRIRDWKSRYPYVGALY